MIHVQDLYRLLEVADIFDANGDEKPAILHEHGYSPIIQGCIEQEIEESIRLRSKRNCYCFFVNVDDVVHPLYVTASSYGKALVTMALELDYRGVTAEYGIRNELVKHVLDVLDDTNIELCALMIDTILELGAETESELEEHEHKLVPFIKTYGEPITWSIAKLLDATRVVFNYRYLTSARLPCELKVIHKKMGTTPDNAEELLYWYFFFAAYDNRKVLFPYTLYKDMLEYEEARPCAKSNFIYNGISE